MKKKKKNHKFKFSSLHIYWHIIIIIIALKFKRRSVDTVNIICSKQLLLIVNSDENWSLSSRMMKHLSRDSCCRDHVNCFLIIRHERLPTWLHKVTRVIIDPIKTASTAMVRRWERMKKRPTRRWDKKGPEGNNLLHSSIISIVERVHYSCSSSQQEECGWKINVGVW